MNDSRIELAMRNPYIRLLALLTGLFFFGWFVYGLRGVLTPLLISFLIAYLLDPVVDRFEARGINRTLAILILMVVLFISTSVFIFLIALAVRDFSDVIKNDLPNWLENVVMPWLNDVTLPWISSTFDLDLNRGGRTDYLSGIVQEVRGQLASFVPRLAGPIRTILTSALSGTLALVAWVANLILIPLFSFYLLRDFDKIVAKARGLIPRHIESDVAKVFREIDETVSAFVRGQLLVMLILGVLYGIGLSISQVKMGFGIGLIAGLLCVIPYLGFFAGISMALIMSLMGGDNIWWNLIGTGITFGVVQALEGTIITPKVVGDKVGLHPVWVILSLMVGAHILGVLGMLLAIPAAAVIKIIINRALKAYRESEYFIKKVARNDSELDESEGDTDEAEPAGDRSSSDEDSERPDEQKPSSPKSENNESSEECAKNEQGEEAPLDEDEAAPEDEASSSEDGEDDATSLDPDVDRRID